MVDDSRFVLASNVRVYSQSGAVVHASSLKPGMKITFILDRKSSADVITELAITSSK